MGGAEGASPLKQKPGKCGSCGGGGLVRDWPTRPDCGERCYTIRCQKCNEIWEAVCLPMEH